MLGRGGLIFGGGLEVVSTQLVTVDVGSLTADGSELFPSPKSLNYYDVTISALDDHTRAIVTGGSMGRSSGASNTNWEAGAELIDNTTLRVWTNSNARHRFNIIQLRGAKAVHKGSLDHQSASSTQSAALSSNGKIIPFFTTGKVAGTAQVQHGITTWYDPSDDKMKTQSFASSTGAVGEPARIFYNAVELY
jgi:hypothetical protein